MGAAVTRHKWVPFEDGYRCERCLAKRWTVTGSFRRRRRFRYAIPGWGPLRSAYVSASSMPSCRREVL